ncbi:sigma 54-interacting transcriptional regulator [Psychrobacillus psychrodurans]|uniref:Sigma 54-interacting transcriptional regulator n=1 Tax=Psychrobacillus psychrodurans TaxID=126157 RepID=A0A9X3RB54_9BACI|nr:sigma 54-interacting transcriptional regulator [Psychrobacillus psychrodurans]MCZ8534856.1 sigma 54-interacting transcriptional regulator [Psychrobacillus psychrodurans]
MQNILIVGAGNGGCALLKLIQQAEYLQVKAIVDIDEKAPGLKLAKETNIPTFKDWKPLLNDDIQIIIDVTGNKEVFHELLANRPATAVLIPGEIANLIVSLLEEKNKYINIIDHKTMMQELIFSSVEEGMIGIDDQGIVNLFNKSAERMTQISVENAIGKHVHEVISLSELPKVFDTGRVELNKELILESGTKIVTSRYPMINEEGKQVGAFAVFKDISEVVRLAEEITNLTEIQKMLEAIIYSSEDAISVVDEEGKGILINPAYTRITGFSEAEVIGQPATADISEGESIHLKVLQTRKPVRGVNLRVGKLKKDVIVNVAPIIVNQQLKGSVGVIHDMTEMRGLMKELDHARTLIRTLGATYSFEDIVGTSNEINFTIEQAKLAASVSVTVLLRGEVGAGKDLFALAIHSESNRSHHPFLRVNCSSTEEHLLETELFGSEKDGFIQPGIFEQAINGTIFLDEVGELTKKTQAKLLRVLRENAIIRVEGTTSIPVDVRIIASSSLNLEKAMLEGTFREDFYYQLNRMPIHIPSLRNRKQDIPAIAEHLLVKLNQEFGRNVEGFSEEAMKSLLLYDWPGNVRELENVISRSMIFLQPNDRTVEEYHLPKSMLVIPSEDKGETSLGTLAEQMDEMEKKVLAQALKLSGGNKSRTAKQLNISLRTLYYKLEKYHLA